MINQYRPAFFFLSLFLSPVAAYSLRVAEGVFPYSDGPAYRLAYASIF